MLGACIVKEKLKVLIKLKNFNYIFILNKKTFK